MPLIPIAKKGGKEEQAEDREETHHGIFAVWSWIAIRNRGTCPGMTFAIW